MAMSRGRQAGGEFLSGYLIEPVSVSTMYSCGPRPAIGIPSRFDYKILTWGIVGAAIFRLGGSFIGVALLARFVWLTMVLGILLIATAMGVAIGLQREFDVQQSTKLLELFRRLIQHGYARLVEALYQGQWPASGDSRLWNEPGLDNNQLLSQRCKGDDRCDGLRNRLGRDERYSSRLQSVPAILSVSREQLVVFRICYGRTLGRPPIRPPSRGLQVRFKYFKICLSIVLVLVGTRLVLAQWYYVPIAPTILAIALSLGVGVVASIFLPARKRVTW